MHNKLSLLWLLLLLVCVPLIGYALPTPDATGVIVFARIQDGVSNIFLVKPDGSQLHRVITDGRDPFFNTDGSKIYFVRGRDIYSVNQSGANLTQITHHGLGINVANPVISQDGTIILYNSAPVVPNPIMDIRLFSTNGSGERTIVRNGLDPSFTPDGVQVIFARGGDIYSMSRNSMGGPAYTPGVLLPHGLGVTVRYPVYGPGNFGGVVFAIRPVAPNAAWSIHAVKFSMQRNEITLAENANQPAFCPDGSRLAFVRNGDIYVMNANGSSQQAVTSGAEADSHPSWWTP